ncbi:hypothetical protein [Pulveribacter sp.]|uniref:hypothetical protein n=1 Tax=Pulveribacter sp. TaxID=2678893 RepID=UPI0028AA64CC|nr:hypothetical protein [Pulveribacter sp.]
MANKFYPKGAEKILGGQVNFTTGTIAVAIVATGYTYSDAHEFLSDAGTLVGSPVVLAGKTVVGGVFDADDAAFGALAPGSTAKALVMYRDTGNPATSPLIAYLDEITGFPFNTNGGDVSVPWSDGPAKILSLV